MSNSAAEKELYGLLLQDLKALVSNGRIQLPEGYYAKLASGALDAEELPAHLQKIYYPTGIPSAYGKFMKGGNNCPKGSTKRNIIRIIVILGLTGGFAYSAYSGISSLMANGFSCSIGFTSSAAQNALCEQYSSIIKFINSAIMNGQITAISGAGIAIGVRGVLGYGLDAFKIFQTTIEKITDIICSAKEFFWESGPTPAVEAQVAAQIQAVIANPQAPVVAPVVPPAGGRRRKSTRKTSRKGSRKVSKKSRKSTRKVSKKSRKGSRKVSKKSRKGSRKAGRR